MADIIDRRPGGGGASGDNVRYHDEGDSSFSQAQAAHLRAWNSDTLTWDRVLVDPATGNLKTSGVGGGGGSGTQYAEDTVSGAGDLLTMAGVVRKDAAGTLVDADGDRTQLQVDARGSLRVGPTAAEDGGTGTGLKTVLTGFNNEYIVSMNPFDGDSMAGSRLWTNAALALWNGTSFDRGRGDITNGLDVDVTRVQGTVATEDATPGLNRSASGALTAVAQTVVVNSEGCGSGTMQIFGPAANATIVVEGTVDGTQWQTIRAAQDFSGSTRMRFDSSMSSVAGLWHFACQGYKQVRARCTAYTSGTSTTYLSVSKGSTVTILHPNDASSSFYSTLANSAGSSLGNRTPSADGVATSSIGLDTAAFLYGFNGTTWDRLRSDTTNGLDVDLTRWIGSSAPTVGQKAMTSSLPVVIASDQSAVPVSGTFWQATQPVSGPLTDAQLRASAVSVDTELPAAAALTDNMANPTVPQVAAHAMVFDGSTWDRETQGLTDTQLRASSVPVSGTFWQATQPVSGTFWQATQPVSGPLTDAQLRAAVVPVGDGAGSLTVDAPVGTPVFVRLSDGAATLIGQKVMASSLPVVIASDQTALTVVGDVDHDAVNTLKNEQIAGHASPVDLPPTAVSAVGDRVRAHFDRYGANVVRRRKIRESYTAVYRLAEAAARLDQTFTQVANTNKQWATIHHAATATKEIRLQMVKVYITADTVAGIQGVFELRELSSATPPATGNPVITPRPHRIGTGVAEATCLYLPTTQGSEASVNQPLGHVPFDTGISGAVSTVNPVPILQPVVLYDSSAEDDEVLPPTAPVGVYGGWAVAVRTVGVPVLRLTVVIKFTEEIP